MKKILFAFICFFTLIWLKPVKAQVDYDNSYLIKDFQSSIEIEKNTNLLITEKIVADFNSQKHGIFRIIPIIYSAKGKTIKAGFNLIAITDENGQDYNYEKSRTGQSIQLKIGNPETLVTGEKIYIIKYEIADILQRFENHDELYWNVTGSEWDTEIESAGVLVNSQFAEIINSDCFAGPKGSSYKYCKFDQEQSSAEFFSQTILGNDKDFTIVVALAKSNQLVYPGILQQTTNLITDNWGYLISIIPTVLILYIWNKRGRDKRYLSENIYFKPDNVATKTVSLFERKHIPLVYHPINGLSPSEVGTIIDEKVDIRDVVAETIELARLNFIKIKKIETKKVFGKQTDYAFIKQSKAKDTTEVEKLKDYQKYLLKELFRDTFVSKSITKLDKIIKNSQQELKEMEKLLINNDCVFLSALENNFYIYLAEFKKKIYQQMKQEGFFDGDPEKVRQKWLGIFIFIQIVASVVMFIFTIQTYNFFPFIILGLGLVPGIILSLSMPRRVPKGYSLFRQIEGLRWYLNKGKWRYEVQEKELFIEEILPLAVSLGVVNKIAKDMKELGIKPPDYFTGSTVSAFSSDFGLFSKTTQTSLLSSPSGKWSGASSWSGGSGFSGGGFSGGGFGGGGGGSW